MEITNIIILMILNNFGKYMRYKEILDIMNKDNYMQYANLSRIIKNLADQGLVIQKKTQTIPPIVHVSISDMGRNFLQGLYPLLSTLLTPPKKPTNLNRNEAMLEKNNMNDISNLELEIDELLKNEFADLELSSETQDIITKLPQKIGKIVKKYLF